MTLEMEVPTELVPLCPDDGKHMIPNLRCDDSFVEDAGWHAASERYADFISDHEGKKVLLVKPQTFMNNSGEAVRDVIKFYKADPEKDLLVIFDDISLDPGSIRIRPKGSAGGHNGIKSIIANLGSENFARIKIGVGSKIPGQDLANHVLGRFSDSDRLKVDDAVMKAVEATSVILTEGISKAQNLFN